MENLKFSYHLALSAKIYAVIRSFRPPKITHKTFCAAAIRFKTLAAAVTESIGENISDRDRAVFTPAIITRLGKRARRE